MTGKHLIDSLSMSNIIVPSEYLMVGGQPSEHDFELLAAIGITQVVNLRPETEHIPFDESVLAKKWGMQYQVIEITTADSCTKEKAKLLKDVLDKGEPTLVHCASGNRVGALIALMSHWLEGISADKALTIGLRAGLTKHTDDIKQILHISP